MTTVQAADAAVEEAIRLSKDVGIPDNFGVLRSDSYDKNRMNTGRYAGVGDKIPTDGDTVHRIAEHMMGDYCPGNPRECTVEALVPLVDHAFNKSY